MSRRTLLVGGAAAATALALARTAGTFAASPVKPLRLGGPIFVQSDDPEVLAQAHRDLGYRAAYVPNGVTVDDSNRIAAIVKAMAARDVVIAEVGAWRNLLDPDPVKRKDNVAYVTGRLALAEAIGARTCVDIAGSFNPTVWSGAHPDNLSQGFFDATVETARKVIDAVRPTRTAFSIEMMPWSWPSSADEYLKLFRAIDRKAFAVHVDVCNLMNAPSRMYNNGAVIEDCFRKLGRWVVSCHAKDVNWVPGYQVNVQEVIPGRGVIDYKIYLRELAKLPVDAPLMLEHLRNAEEYAEGRQYIQGVAKAVGLSFDA
jgi:sugar phosphate isomerase/epimerase